MKGINRLSWDLCDDYDGQEYVILCTTLECNKFKPVGNYKGISPKQDLPISFRLLDGDNNVYFAGYTNKENFLPLDAYGSLYGCTAMQTYNMKTNKWETL